MLLLAVLLLYLPFAGNSLVFDDGMTLNAARVQIYRDWHTLLDMRGLPHVTFYWTNVAGRTTCSGGALATCCCTRSTPAC